MNMKDRLAATAKAAAAQTPVKDYTKAYAKAVDKVEAAAAKGLFTVDLAPTNVAQSKAVLAYFRSNYPELTIHTYEVGIGWVVRISWSVE